MEIEPNATFVNNLSSNQPSRCVDLIVLGINYRSNEEDVRKYFQQFGELVFCEVSPTMTMKSYFYFHRRSNVMPKVNRVALVSFVLKIMNHS